MRRSKKRNKQRKIIVVSLVSLLCIMTAGYAAFQTNLNIRAKGNIIEKSRTIQSWESTSNEDFHTDFYRENIITVTFLDNNKVPENAIESWDVSEIKDGGVMAYVLENQIETGKYDLYIGSNGAVIANKQSSHMFYKFSNVKTITFEDNFDTSNATTMAVMFNACTNLIALDLSNFNTANVINMRDMFSSCHNLETLKFGDNFNTSNVVDMWAMFYNDYKLSNIDLSNFNTSKVTTMWGMFNNTNVTELNLCSFDTSKVTDMSAMFRYTANLNKVKVGQNWTTKNATIVQMWSGSNISSVTTGEC